MNKTIMNLQKYNHSIKDSLYIGEKFTHLIDTLISTQNINHLLSAVTNLVNYSLDTNYLYYIHKYSQNDYYLIFMERIFDLNNLNSNFTIKYNQKEKSLEQNIKNDDSNLLFSFQKDNKDGAMYKEKHSDESLFYINLKYKQLIFNSNSLIQLFIKDNNKLSNSKIQYITNILKQFGNLLKKDYQFKVNFSILNNNNNVFYKFNNKEISTSIIDQLFVESAKYHYMLTSNSNEQAKIILNNNVSMNICQHNDQWGLIIHYNDKEVSWFNLILDYPFLKKWYLNNLKDLEINNYIKIGDIK